MSIDTRPKGPRELVDQFLETPPTSLGIPTEQVLALYDKLVFYMLKGDQVAILECRSEFESGQSDLLPTSFASANYIPALRQSLRFQEDAWQSAVSDVEDGTQLSAAQLTEREHRLRQNTVDLSVSSPDRDRINEFFPSGNWIYHATSADRITRILRDGYIRSTADVVRLQGPSAFLRANGGSLGISWNFNRVESLVGDRRHLAGFLADPEVVLRRQGGILAVPAKCCPSELQYYKSVPQSIEDIREAEAMLNLTTGILKQLDVFRRTLDDGKPDEMVKKDPIARQYVTRLAKANAYLAESAEPDYLRRYYVVTSDKKFRFAAHLPEDELACIDILVFIQASADGALGADSQRQLGGRLPRRIDQTTLATLGPAAMVLASQSEQYMSSVCRQIGPDSTIKVPNLLFCCPTHDYEKWLPVLTRALYPPKGVVLYDGHNVRAQTAYINPLPKDGSEALNQQLQRLGNAENSIAWSSLFDGSPHPGRVHYLIDRRQTASAGLLTIADGKLKAQTFDEIYDD